MQAQKKRFQANQLMFRLFQTTFSPMIYGIFPWHASSLWLLIMMSVLLLISFFQIMTTPTLVSNMTSCMVCANIKCLAQRSEAVPLQRCSDCSGVAYCGDKCHQKGWVTHKVVCHKMKGASWDKKIALVTSMISQSTSLGSKEGENNSNQGWPQGLPSPSFSRSDHHRGEEEQHSPTSPWPPTMHLM